MELDEAIINRRSCRSYDTTRTVTEAQLREILLAGTWAPSGHNSQPWRFTVLTGAAKADYLARLRASLETKRGKLEKEAENIAFWSATSLEKGSAIILVWSNAKGGVNAQSIGACIQNMLLKAHGMCLGTLWVAAVKMADDDVLAPYNHPDWDLAAAVGVGYMSEKMIGKKGPPRLGVDEVAEFRS
jgi:nitroreductase